MLPRGGGAFVAEMDGNLTCSKTDALATVHWQGKFRGPDFAPIPFMLTPAFAEGLKDSKGRGIPTVIAKSLSEQERTWPRPRPATTMMPCCWPYSTARMTVFR